LWRNVFRKYDDSCNTLCIRTIYITGTFCTSLHMELSAEKGKQATPDIYIYIYIYIVACYATVDTV
jgi:hypothetical protein